MRHDLNSALMMSQGGLHATQDRIAPLERDRFSEVWSQPDRQKRRKLGPRAWHLILTIGDGVLLIAMLLLTLTTLSYADQATGAALALLEVWSVKLVQSCMVLLLWGIATRITQAHDSVNIAHPFKSASSALFALILTYLALAALTYPFVHNNSMLYALLLLVCMLVTIPALCLWRLLLARISILPRFRSRAVIIGANVAGVTLAKELRNAKWPRMTLLGYIHQGSDERQGDETLPILGGRSMLRRLVQGGVVDMIITAADYHTQSELIQEAIEATQQGVSVVPMAIAYERMCGKLPIEHIGEQWYTAVPTEKIVSLFYLCWQKTMDILFALLCMVVLFLLFPILALLIYLDSPGPIFYHQERLGYQGKKFFIHKFRTMRVDAERPGRAIWAKAQDTRVTRIGRFLRATHLDELPQAFNILRGEMSLIGPRPERQEFVAELEKTVPFYRCRLMVKPGLTGWAQVRYRYANTDQDSLVKLQYDLYYIGHQSFMLDLSIILQTIVEMLFCRGI